MYDFNNEISCRYLFIVRAGEINNLRLIIHQFVTASEIFETNSIWCHCHSIKIAEVSNSIQVSFRLKYVLFLHSLSYFPSFVQTKFKQQSSGLQFFNNLTHFENSTTYILYISLAGFIIFKLTKLLNFGYFYNIIHIFSPNYFFKQFVKKKYCNR